MDGLGIDWKLLIAEIVNFAILLFLLKKFLYKPFTNILEQRRAKIEEGIKKSEDAEKSLQKIRSLADDIKYKSEQKAKEIIVNAEKKAQDKTKNILTAADAEKGKIIESARKAMEQEKAAAKELQEKEAVDMAFVLAERVLKEKVNKELDKKLIEKLAADLK